ncbi:PAS domain-containing protein [Pseudemcibacter aquimaris]|uniref:PAS domain-containing protein n=1 Tax=Pseudemcibacter aquimaris TaxID=2857064 RepID=UPI002011649E|nr:PAS domain-containing protein [Pseudemcibacter aquimaris]MCC3862574.1 PAS domain-containing protein [Pseudemcibacter aquimaris]WDU57908.1 PAS domain-containing protein [Pseudemcibacter aquimaris]
MPFTINDDKTINHPAIKDFLADCNKATNGDLLSVQYVQTYDLIKYSKWLIISEYDDEKNDFKFRYSGSKVCSFYGMEITGKYISETASEDNIEPLINIYKDIIKTRNTVYLSGTLKPRGKAFIDWHMVSQPLIRNDQINEVIGFVIFDDNST